MLNEESLLISSSESDSDIDHEDKDLATSGILFFKKLPKDESRLAKNSIIYKRNHLEKGLTKDKRVTVQQVLDKRTYIRLKRLHGRGIFDYIYGVISTGKEANVYEAEGTLASKKHRMAIKVYKTSILIFKDRSRYIEGEFRFRRSYVGTKNPRKMVSQWAEKEFRNLRRISLSGVYCPCPIALKDHILVMELIQDSNDNVASKLKDLGQLPITEWLQIYAQVISIMRVLYQESKLIHADFSAYNLLYTGSKVIVIDVSQTVENDHPNAMYFLKRDCENITTFFTSITFSESLQEDDFDDPISSFNLLTSFQLFNFITNDTDFMNSFDQNFTYDVDDYVTKMTLTSKNANFDQLTQAMLRKRAFYSAFCSHVYHLLLTKDASIFINEAIESVNFISNEAVWNSINHINLSCLTLDVLDKLQQEDNLPQLSKLDISHESVEELEFEDESEDKSEAKKFTGKIPEGVDAKEWKRMVKAMNRERREHKIPKHIKKSFKHKH